jgi:hypothetical protein
MAAPSDSSRHGARGEIYPCHVPRFAPVIHRALQVLGVVGIAWALLFVLSKPLVALMSLGAVVMLFRLAARVRANLVVFSGGLRIERMSAAAVEVATRDIRAVLACEGRSLRFSTRRLRDVDIELRGDADAAELAKRIGLDPARRVVHVPMRATVGAATLAFVTFWVVWVSAYAAIGGRDFSKPIALFTTGLATVLAAAVAVIWRRRGVTIGADGVRIRRVFGSRFVPFREVRAIEGDALRLLNDEVVEVASLHDALQHTLRDAFAAFQREQDQVSNHLARGERTVRDWRAELSREDHGYRGAHLPAEVLEQVLRNPRALAEVRVGAALALRAQARSADDTPHVRVAIEQTRAATVDAELRAALDAVLADSLEDAHVERLRR